MNLKFINGNEQQKDAVRFVVHHLLNFPFGAIPLNWEIEFIADPDPAAHNEFAVTTYTYGSPNAVTKIASRAPNWGQPYKGIQFLNETVAHELGHALFAMLPQKFRTQIAEMFGAKSDSLTELQPPGSDWEDRYIEGIAETFKDAFLPRRYRRYSNRTTRHISISLYPAFRRIFRQGMEESAHEFIGPDGVDANHQDGETGDGIFTPEEIYTEGIFTTYEGFGRYAQLANEGDSILAAVDRLQTGDLLSIYGYQPRLTAGWAESFISAPVKEITLPKNAGEGWVSTSFGLTVISGGGGLFTFSEPAWVYSGRAAFLLGELHFIKGSGGSFPGPIIIDWDAPIAPSLFVEGTPPYMSLATEMPPFPPEAPNSYIFSSIELPISTSRGVLGMEPTIFAQAKGASDAAITAAVAALFDGAGEQVDVPTSLVQPLGWRGGSRRSKRLISGGRAR